MVFFCRKQIRRTSYVLSLFVLSFSYHSHAYCFLPYGDILNFVSCHFLTGEPPVFPTSLVSYLMPETASCRRSAIVSILAALAVAVCLLAIFGGIGIRQAYADGTENIAFSVPAKVPFAVKADGTVVGPSASAWRIKNDGTRPLRIKDVAASGFDDGSTVSAVSEAMPVASTLTRGIWSINVSRGGRP